MYLKRTETPRVVRLSDGTSLSRADLPRPQETHWTASRKATVVSAVDAGLMPLAEALELYNLSAEEFDDWRRAMHRHGRRGLKATAGVRASSLHSVQAEERQ